MSQEKPAANDMYGDQSDEEDVKVAAQEPIKPAPLPKAKLPDVRLLCLLIHCKFKKPL
jgi:hypothetical protein